MKILIFFISLMYIFSITIREPDLNFLKKKTSIVILGQLDFSNFELFVLDSYPFVSYKKIKLLNAHFLNFNKNLKNVNGIFLLSKDYEIVGLEKGIFLRNNKSYSNNLKFQGSKTSWSLKFNNFNEFLDYWNQ